MKRYTSYLPAAVVFVILCLAPTFFSTYVLGLLILTLIYGIFAMSLDILTGYAGLPSLGHAMFFGISAYTVGILEVKMSANFGLQLIAGLSAAVVIGAGFGLLAVRSKGISFVMITLSLSMVLWGLASNLAGVTGGTDGLPGISRPKLSPVPLDLEITSSFYYFVLGFFIVSALLMYLIARSPFGYTLLGIRESETRMSCLGYNVWRYKYLCFIVAGVFAGLAGILSVYYNGFVNPGDLGIETSAKVLFMVILGGAGTLFGPLIGACSIVLLENFISAYSQRWPMILGAIYVLVVLFAPDGVYDPMKRFIRRFVRL
jgi:branched-chain amino acid transport system permease protein